MTLNIVSRLITALSLFQIVFLSVACSSSGTAAPPNNAPGTGGLSSSGGASAAAGTGGAAGTTACPDFLGSPVPGTGPSSGCHDGACFGCLTEIEPMSFALGMFSITDDSGVTTGNPRTEAGAVCMSGQSVAWAILNLVLGPPDHQIFDAAALGITQLEFTVETPPSNGVNPNLAVVVAGAGATGFSLTSGGALVSITATTTVKASLSDYTSPDYVLDPSQLLGVGFVVSAAEHYDFCIRDLKFFDANDVEVLPPS